MGRGTKATINHKLFSMNTSVAEEMDYYFVTIIDNVNIHLIIFQLFSTNIHK